MKQAKLLLALLMGVIVTSAQVNAQSATTYVTEAMKSNCMAAVKQLVDTYDVASQAKTRAVSAVQQQCAFSKEVVERAVRLAAGTSTAGSGCTIVNDSKNVTFIPGESCEARNARLAMAAARGDQGAASAYANPAPYANAPQPIEARIYAALAQGKLLLPPGESAWDLLRSPDAARLSEEQKRALYQEFDSQAKTCFGEALNARPERIERARICLEAIVSVNPRWEHLDRERRRLAVAIDPVGVTAYGVDAVLSGKAREMAAQGVAPAPQPTTYYPAPAPQPVIHYPATVPMPGQGAASSSANQTGLASTTSDPATMELPGTGPSSGNSSYPPAPSPALASQENPFGSALNQQQPRPQPQPIPYTPPAPQSVVTTNPLVAPDAATYRHPAPALSRSTVRKVALVIGNSRYVDPQWGVLPNTINDVHLISNSLRSIGFDVTERVDVTRDDMISAYSLFEAKANGADIALIYYAGHAVQIAGENVLMGINAPVGMLTAMRDIGLNADSLRLSMSGASLRMLVLDSCRDNPYSSRSGNQFVASRGVSTGGGLLAIRANDGIGRKGSVVLFSTAPGEQASDGDGANSPFAQAFAKHVVVPGVPLQDFVIDVQKEVMSLTGNLQQPFTDSSLLEKDVFLAGDR